MVHGTVTQKNLKKLKGKILKDFSYSITYEDFISSERFKTIKTFAFVLALISMFIGVMLPFFVGFFTSLKDWGTEAFQVNMISNSIIAIVFCLPLSLVFIVGALPLYNRIITTTLKYYGFPVTPKSLKKQIA